MFINTKHTFLSIKKYKVLHMKKFDLFTQKKCFIAKQESFNLSTYNS